MADVLRREVPARGVIRLAGKLRTHYRTAMLTNHIATWHRYVMRTFRLDALFDVVVTSYEERLAKPDPRIYRAVMRKLGIPASRCVYIDDLAHNIPPARRLGMTALHFRGIRQLERDLRRIGVAWT